MTYHYIYKTTNKITRKYYIGAHSTYNLDDGYIGSGKLIKEAIKKYGIDNFYQEILEYFDSRNQAFIREAEIVTEAFASDPNNYNMCPGGLGSAIKTEEFKRRVSMKLKGRKLSPEHSMKKSLAQQGEKNHRYGKPNPNNPRLSGSDNGMFNKKHTEESRRLMSERRKESIVEYTPELKLALSAACKGKLWYNDGYISKRFIEGTQPEGFIKGRISPIKIRKDMGLG